MHRDNAVDMSRRRKRKWTVERFTNDGLPLISESLIRHAELGLRESAILTSAMIDVGLAEAISKRLSGPEHEIVEFIGGHEDGRAPCASFGSRIQAGRLLGILTDEDVVLLRHLKDLRNIAAHRLKCAVTDKGVADILCKIWDDMRGPLTKLYVFLWALVQGSPGALRKAEASLEQPKLQIQIDTLKGHIPKLAEFDSMIRKNFASTTLVNNPHISFNAASIIYIPQLLRTNERVATIMLAILSALYNSRLGLLIESITPIKQVELPSKAIKMWDSDIVRQ